MLTVHHLENSRSHRIVWLLEELGVDYDIKRYARDSQTGLAPPELVDVHPLGKAPVVTDLDRTLAESGAVIEYLVYEYDDGSLKPADGTAEQLAYTYWLHYSEGSFSPLMLLSLVLARIEDAPVPFFLKPVTRGIAGKVRDGFLDANVKRHMDYMESALSRSTWFCGDRFTAADVQMSFAIEAAEVRTDLSGYPRLAGFLESIRARPAYQRAIEKGGQHALMSVSRK